MNKVIVKRQKLLTDHNNLGCGALLRQVELNLKGIKTNFKKFLIGDKRSDYIPYGWVDIFVNENELKKVTRQKVVSLHEVLQFFEVKKK